MGTRNFEVSTTLHSPEPSFGSRTSAGRLAMAIYSTATTSPDKVALVLNAGTPCRRTVTYRELGHQLSNLETQLQPTDFPGLVLLNADITSLVLMSAACGRCRIPLAVLSQDSSFLADRLTGWLHINYSLSPTKSRVLAALGENATTCSPQGGVFVATSGTTGPPKLIGHSWDKLVAGVRLTAKWHDRAWALVYDTARWAGLQVWLQALLTGGRAVVPASHDPDVVAIALVEEQVTILPTTPTLLRRLLQSADPGLLRAACLETITLGGEIADSSLFELAAVSFPEVRVTHVYATSELGEVFHVTDGKAGFPAAWIDRRLASGAYISVSAEGELLVRSAQDSTHIRTGDLVTPRGNRLEFVGRHDDVISVGGAKVYPEQVEAVIRSIPGIADVRVYGVPNPVTGFIVATEVVFSDPLLNESKLDDMRAAVFATCRSRLAAHAVPRSIVTVTRIAASPTPGIGSTTATSDH